MEVILLKPSIPKAATQHVMIGWSYQPGGGGGTLGISGWGCAAGTLESLTYTRASSPEFCYAILE